MANVWPVVDAQTGFVFRYFMRAYAMHGPDALISSTLQTLAPTDFRLAEVFPIPERFQVSSEHGTLKGIVSIRDFYRYQGEILEPAFRALERASARVQGISGAGTDTAVPSIRIIPRFSKTPYLLATSIVEMPNGELLPQIRKRSVTTQKGDQQDSDHASP